MSRPEGEYVELREVSQYPAENRVVYPAAAAYIPPQAQAAPLPTYAPVNTVVPPTPTIGQLEEKFRERRVDFNSKRYISDGWNFARHNCCAIFSIALTWCLIFLILHLAALFLIGRPEEYNGPTDNGPGPDAHGIHPVFTAHRFQSFSTRRLLAHFLDNNGDEPAPPQPGSASSDSHEDNGKRIAWIVFLVLQCLLIESPLQSSLFQATFNAMRTNTRLKWKDSFSCFNGNYYFKLMPLTIFLGIGYLVGYHLFILPGIWFSIISLFARPLHLEHQPLSACKAINLSYKSTRKYFWNILCFGILILLFNVLGFLALIVGLLITLPVSFFALCYCYHSLVGVNGVPYLAVEPAAPAAVAPAASAAPSPIAPTPTVTHATYPTATYTAPAPAATTTAPVYTTGTPIPTSAYPQLAPIAGPAVSPITYAYPAPTPTPAPGVYAPVSSTQYTTATYGPTTTVSSPPAASAGTQNVFFAAYPVIAPATSAPYRPTAPSSAPTTFVGARS